jgi:hypothetical protein
MKRTKERDTDKQKNKEGKRTIGRKKTNAEEEEKTRKKTKNIKEKRK